MFDIVPNTTIEIEKMNTAMLLEAIDKAEKALDLAVIGILNTDFRSYPDALYQIQGLYRDLVNELVNRVETGRHSQGTAADQND